jgi:hypothetical protein
MRRTRRVILHAGQTIDDLDLWPGDQVWLHGDFLLLGNVNREGMFVPALETLN